MFIVERLRVVVMAPPAPGAGKDVVARYGAPQVSCRWRSNATQRGVAELKSKTIQARRAEVWHKKVRALF